MTAVLTRRSVVVSLPRIEITFYFMVWILHSTMAFYLAWDVCSRLRQKFFLEASQFISGYQKDNSDAEWAYYSKSLKWIVLVNVLHTVLFKLCPLLLPERLSQYFLLLFWITLHACLTSTPCVITVIVLAAVMGIVAHYWQNELISWFILIMFMIRINSVAYFSKSDEIYYREFNYYLYSAVKILNFCIYLSRNKATGPINSSLFFRYAQYIFYPPYSVSLVVLFDDFDAQMMEVEKDRWKCINCRALTLLLLRIILWYVMFETLLHMIYVYALFASDPTLFNSLSEYQLATSERQGSVLGHMLFNFASDSVVWLATEDYNSVASVAYVNGQFFYMKYLLIFGIPSWFALADGMRPPGGPICISRISKYSQLWRTFDRGLYVFLKKQVYIPVVGDPSGKFYALRRFSALVTVFLFVLTWHGTSSNYVYWVLCNGLELCMEWIAADISKTAFWYKIQKFLGPRGERRLIAVCMLVANAPGIFGVFFFLSRKRIGIIIFKRIFVNLLSAFFQMILNLPGRSLKFGMMCLHFFALGYCFNNVCLEIEKYYAAKDVSRDKVRKR